jgi:hypothetical protein
MDTKIYGINSYEILENKKQKINHCDVFLASMPIELWQPFNHMLAMGIHGLMSFKGMLVIVCKAQCTYS